jgi:hypothetical protein
VNTTLSFTLTVTDSHLKSSTAVQKVTVIHSVTPPSGNLGPDGVFQVFPTVAGGSEVYLADTPDKSKFNVSYGTGSHLPYTKQQEGKLTYFNSVGNRITYASGSAPGRSLRLDMYADGGMWANKTPYSWKSNPGYLYTPKGIDNGEYTVLIRPHGQLHTHESAAWKLAGRDDDSIRSVFEINGADGEHSSPRANWNYAHFPYVHAPVQVASSFGKLTADKWYGLKAVRIVDPSKKFTDYYLFDDPNPVDSNGNLNNNWRLIAHAHDAGTSGYDNIPSTWKSQRDTFRSDGFQSWDFAKMSVREIDTSRTPAIPLNTLLHQNAFVAQGQDDDNLDSVEEAAAASTSTSTASQTQPQEQDYSNTQNNLSSSSPSASTTSSLQFQAPLLTQKEQQQLQSPPLMQQMPQQPPSPLQGPQPPSSLFLH